MTTYRVKWEIDIEAETAEEAAREALAVQRDPKSIATVFEVAASVNGALSGYRWLIDLGDDESEESTCAEIKAAHAADSP